MKPGLRNLAAGTAVLAVLLGAFLLVTHWTHRESRPYAAGPDSPRLVIDPDWTDGGLYARMSGVLGINEQGCIRLDGNVVLAQAGSRVAMDGSSVTFAHHAPVEIGGFVSDAGGGTLGRRRWIEAQMRGIADGDLVDALEGCLGHHGRPVVQLWFD